MRIYKFATQRIAPNCTITYQSFSGYSIQIDGWPADGYGDAGKIERMVPRDTMYAVEIFGLDYKIVYSFKDAKAALRAMLAKHFPVEAKT